jgi:hypothetical protein
VSENNPKPEPPKTYLMTETGRLCPESENGKSEFPLAWGPPTMPKLPKPAESIEVEGIRFTAQEVEYVTIKRNGRQITIAAKPEDEKKIGFGK